MDSIFWEINLVLVFVKEGDPNFSCNTFNHLDEAHTDSNKILNLCKVRNPPPPHSKIVENPVKNAMMAQSQLYSVFAALQFCWTWRTAVSRAAQLVVLCLLYRVDDYALRFP